MTPKLNLDNAIFDSADESSMLGLDPDEKYNDELDEQDSICLTSTLAPQKTIIELTTKSYVDSLSENSRNK